MIPIKRIGRLRFNNRKNAESCSLFLCPQCGKEVVKPTGEGNRLKTCSQSCGERFKPKRGRNKIIINGYSYTYAPEHPNCLKMGYVATHRLVLEEKLGRFLEKGEVAHHVNENKLDNRPENIKLMTASEHSSYHMKERWTNGIFPKV